jgi:hypothetical protein
MTTPNYIFNEKLGHHIFNINRGSKRMTFTVDGNATTSVTCAFMHDFKVEDLAAMQVPNDYNDPMFFYIKAEMDDGRRTAYWIESEAEAKILRRSINNAYRDWRKSITAVVATKRMEISA